MTRSRATDWVPLDRTFTHRLHTLLKLTDRVTQTAYEAEAGLPAHEGRCLAAVGTFSPLSVNDLAHHANLDKGQASRAAQSLVAQGLLSKTSSPTDGRGVVLNLTPAGRKVWLRTIRMVTRRNQEITACLQPEQLAQLDQLLDLLVAHARSSAQDMP